MYVYVVLSTPIYLYQNISELNIKFCKDTFNQAVHKCNHLSATPGLAGADEYQSASSDHLHSQTEDGDLSSGENQNTRGKTVPSAFQSLSEISFFK